MSSIRENQGITRTIRGLFVDYLNSPYIWTMLKINYSVFFSIENQMYYQIFPDEFGNTQVFLTEKLEEATLFSTTTAVFVLRYLVIRDESVQVVSIAADPYSYARAE